jgi:3-phenylpropionate/trans-cinnamate dioxygenase ferredoxin reductase subunit
VVSQRHPVVIVGAGHAGVQVAASLREEGYDGPIKLIGDEPDPPYHRPPLSKSFVTGADAELDPLRGAQFYSNHSIDLLTETAVVEIDPPSQRIHLDTGEMLPFSHLVLAVGSCNRPLPVPGADLDGVLSLRTANDARMMRQRLGEARHAVVIGGGFIGMEFAAAVAKAGVDVVLLEAAPRTMTRAVTPHVSRYLEHNQRACGVQIELNAGVSGIAGRNGKATAVLTADGRRVPADVVLIGVGAKANTALASAAGLEVATGVCDGIIVDDEFRTSHADISAIGDCARFPAGGHMMRLESVQNAVDQARHVAVRLAGRPAPSYERVPWFWSDQGLVKLQIAGLCADADRIVVRGEPESRKFSVIGLVGDRVVSVESLNKPGDHMAARKLLAANATLSEAEAADTTFPLKAALANVTTDR